MGRQVLSGSVNQSKHQMVVSDVLVGVISVGSQDLIVWVGSTALATKNYVEINSALRRCRDAIIEFGSPEPIADFEVVAHCVPTDPKSAVDVVNQAALPSLTEADVAILYGNGATEGASSKLIVDRINMAIEKFLEDQKAA